MLCASKGHSDPHTVLTGYHPLKVGKCCKTSCPCKQGWVSLLPWGSGTRRHRTFSSTLPQWFSKAPGHLQQVMLTPWDAASGGSPLDLPYTSMAACWRSTPLTLQPMESQKAARQFNRATWLTAFNCHQKHTTGEEILNIAGQMLFQGFLILCP